MNLGQPDPFYVLPVLVFVTMFVQTRISTPPKPKVSDDAAKKGKQQDDPTAAMTQSMQYTMPLMFGFFSLSFQAGLSIYFILSNVIGIGQGYYTRKVMEKEKVVREESTKIIAEDAGAEKGRPTAVLPPMKRPEESTSNATTASAKQNIGKRIPQKQEQRQE
ncbi:MAG: hypothetical protein HC804_09985 [Anaerolineae bacterium]|nr:hypothetical protein [Anaerolineae bacterium]